MQGDPMMQQMNMGDNPNNPMGNALMGQGQQRPWPLEEYQVAPFDLDELKEMILSDPMVGIDEHAIHPVSSSLWPSSVYLDPAEAEQYAADLPWMFHSKSQAIPTRPEVKLDEPSQVTAPGDPELGFVCTLNTIITVEPVTVELINPPSSATPATTVTLYVPRPTGTPDEVLGRWRLRTWQETDGTKVHADVVLEDGTELHLAHYLHMDNAGKDLPLPLMGTAQDLETYLRHPSVSAAEELELARQWELELDGLHVALKAHGTYLGFYGSAIARQWQMGSSRTFVMFYDEGAFQNFYSTAKSDFLQEALLRGDKFTELEGVPSVLVSPDDGSLLLWADGSLVAEPFNGQAGRWLLEDIQQQNFEITAHVAFVPSAGQPKSYLAPAQAPNGGLTAERLTVHPAENQPPFPPWRITFYEQDSGFYAIDLQFEDKVLQWVPGPFHFSMTPAPVLVVPETSMAKFFGGDEMSEAMLQGWQGVLSAPDGRPLVLSEGYLSTTFVVQQVGQWSLHDVQRLDSVATGHLKYTAPSGKEHFVVPEMRYGPAGTQLEARLAEAVEGKQPWQLQVNAAGGLAIGKEGVFVDWAESLGADLQPEPSSGWRPQLELFEHAGELVQFRPGMELASQLGFQHVDTLQPAAGDYSMVIPSMSNEQALVGKVAFYANEGADTIPYKKSGCKAKYVLADADDLAGRAVSSGVLQDTEGGLLPVQLPRSGIYVLYVVAWDLQGGLLSLSLRDESWMKAPVQRLATSATQQFAPRESLEDFKLRAEQHTDYFVVQDAQGVRLPYHGEQVRAEVATEAGVVRLSHLWTYQQEGNTVTLTLVRDDGLHVSGLRYLHEDTFALLDVDTGLYVDLAATDELNYAMYVDQVVPTRLLPVGVGGEISLGDDVLEHARESTVHVRVPVMLHYRPLLSLSADATPGVAQGPGEATQVHVQRLGDGLETNVVLSVLQGPTRMYLVPRWRGNTLTIGTTGQQSVFGQLEFIEGSNRREAFLREGLSLSYVDFARSIQLGQWRFSSEPVSTMQLADPMEPFEPPEKPGDALQEFQGVFRVGSRVVGNGEGTLGPLDQFPAPDETVRLELFDDSKVGVQGDSLLSGYVRVGDRYLSRAHEDDEGVHLVLGDKMDPFVVRVSGRTAEGFPVMIGDVGSLPLDSPSLLTDFLCHATLLDFHSLAQGGQPVLRKGLASGNVAMFASLDELAVGEASLDFSQGALATPAEITLFEGIMAVGVRAVEVQQGQPRAAQQDPGKGGTPLAASAARGC